MNSHFDNFFSYTNEHLSEVLTFHLNIEALLSMMLQYNQVAKVAGMSFAKKAAKCYDLNLLNEPFYMFICKLNKLRNLFAHQLGYSVSFEQAHEYAVEAGKAGVDFSDALESTTPAGAKILGYDTSGILNAVFRITFFDVAGQQDEKFWLSVTA